MLKNFDSRKTQATLIFLGLDEGRKEGGLAFKVYQGTPYFAVDVTPRGSEQQQAAAKEVIGAVEAKGLSFFQARVHMTFSADEGTSPREQKFDDYLHPNSCNLRASSRAHGLECP